ncbi:MAG: himA [Phenylobacterium sp.]|jgi:integration host factor subunit alpha|nr:himA [Phenylobacterium sp.]MDB5464695.1 himA [Phenylobacterium sp.]MDB5498648.1 himA [Phenylobacterium sp.]
MLEVFDEIGQSGHVDGIATGERESMKGATVTRADLCEAVHEEVGLTRQDCGELVERVLELMAVALEKGHQVKLSGFGVFQVRAKRARMGRNPKTGEPAAIEPRRVIGFRASQVMKARVDRALGRG